MRKRYLAGLIFSLVSFNTIARTTYSLPFEGGNEDFFVTASLGSTNHVVGDAALPDSFSKEQYSFGFNFDYRIARYISLGAGYVDFGEAEQFKESSTFSGDTETVSLSTAGKGVSLSGMLHTDIKQGPWFFYYRWGMVNWDVQLIDDYSISGSENFAERITISSNGTDSFNGFGGAYYISNNIRIGINYEQYKMSYDLLDEEDNTSDKLRHEFNQTAINLTYSF